MAAAVQGLQDHSPHVRWAACQAIGQMCTDLGPQLQEQQHVAVLPGLMAVMDDFNSPRVQVCLSAGAAGDPLLTHSLASSNHMVDEGQTSLPTKAPSHMQ